MTFNGSENESSAGMAAFTSFHGHLHAGVDPGRTRLHGGANGIEVRHEGQPELSSRRCRYPDKDSSLPSPFVVSEDFPTQTRATLLVTDNPL